ncbi:MAG: amtR [Frankiales bacterium]|nr:amtR [Frankiales bacterium]
MTDKANDRKALEGAAGVLPGVEGLAIGKRRLLEAAVVAVAERGYHGVSVRDLASDTGVQAASFYAHFGSKEELLYELCLLGHREHHRCVRDAILGAGADAREQLRAAIRANIWFHATYPLLTISANSELHALNAEHLATIADLRHDAGTLLTAVVERGNSEGVFDCPEPWLPMSAVGGMCLRVAWWFRPAVAVDEGTLSAYPRQAATWLRPEDYTIERVMDTYADYALKIFGAA